MSNLTSILLTGGLGGGKFHRDVPGNVKLDLFGSIVILVCSREQLIGKKAVLEGGALPAIIFCM